MGKKSKGERTGPGPSLLKLASGLFSDSSEAEKFVRALNAPNENPARKTQSAILVLDTAAKDISFAVEAPSPWMPDWAYRLAPDQKPGGSPLHEAGQIYCLDLSSVFEASVLMTLSSTPIGRCLDLCASPGGKSVFASRALNPGLLVSNEVIGKRTAPLISNLKRCRIPHVQVTSLDPGRFKEFAKDMFEVIIVDAPCSGQSLLARGKHSPGCFHPTTMRMNAGRQKRILGCAGELTAPGGHIAYMTCTFSRDENEDVIEWFLKKNSEFELVSVEYLKPYQSHLTELPCYRMWPHRGEGSGGFTALLRRNGDNVGQAEVIIDLPCVWRSSQLN